MHDPEFMGCEGHVLNSWVSKEISLLYVDYSVVAPDGMIDLQTVS
jgi:hypothetical protein